MQATTMTTGQMMKATSVKLFSLLLKAASDESDEGQIAYECVKAILADRGITVDLACYDPDSEPKGD